MKFLGKLHSNTIYGFWFLTAAVFNVPIKSQFFNAKPLFEKYANSAINEATLVERQGLKYQVNTSKPFSGNFMGFDDEYGFCVNKAGSYKIMWNRLTKENLNIPIKNTTNQIHHHH